MHPQWAFGRGSALDLIWDLTVTALPLALLEGAAERMRRGEE